MHGGPHLIGGTVGEPNLGILLAPHACMAPAEKWGEAAGDVTGAALRLSEFEIHPASYVA